MSPLVKKEIRLLLPAWGVAMIMATAPAWHGQWIVAASQIIFLLAALALALRSFGQETTDGTFDLLLTQPIERRHLWNLKVGLLAASLVSTGILFTLCWHKQSLDKSYSLDVPSMTALIFAGSLWATLLFRDVVVSAFITVLAPLGLYGLTLVTLDQWVNPHFFAHANVHKIVLAAYGIGCFCWSRHLFLNAQNTAWTGPQISWSILCFGTRLGMFEFRRIPNRWVALVKKEIQLQSATLSIMLVLAVLEALALIGRKFIPSWRGEMSGLIIPITWIYSVPMVIGCSAVAEERRMNTLEGLLCLPVRKNTLFSVKFVVAMALGIFLGGVVPWTFFHELHRNTGFWSFLIPVALVTFVSFYTSTLSRSLLQAIPAILVVLFFVYLGFGVIRAIVSGWDNRLIVGNALYGVIVLPILLVAVFLMSRANFARRQVGTAVRLGDLGRVSSVCLCASLIAIGIYERSWELFEPMAPASRTAIIGGTGQAKICCAGAHVAALLPDGRIWHGKIRTDVFPKFSPQNSGAFATGSNWMDLAVADYSNGMAAIRRDGTLWNISDSGEIDKISEATHWTKIAGRGIFAALRDDGSLWAWHPSALPKQVNGCPPLANIFIRDGSFVGFQKDGQIWQKEFTTTPAGYYHIPPQRWHVEGSNIVALAGTGQNQLALFADGVAKREKNIPVFLPSPPLKALSGENILACIDGKGILYERTAYWSGLFRLNYGTNWIAVDSTHGEITALAQDGTISRWLASNFRWQTGNFLGLNVFLRPTRRPVSINILDSK